MAAVLNVNEIYVSLQGESTFAGLPCIFIRLTACNLRCSYCDTAYAFSEGRKMPLPEILAQVASLAQPFQAHPDGADGARLPIVELTGGEPLLQLNALPLMTELCQRGYTLLLETSGALDISAVDPRVHRIMDLKCPGSGEMERNRWENIPLLRKTDELKFVITTFEDYAWAKETVFKHGLHEVCPVLFSWAYPITTAAKVTGMKQIPSHHHLISQRELAEKIIADALPVRFQVQMHKIIWSSDARGV